MEPIKPRTNIDSGYWRTLGIENFSYNYQNTNNNIISVREYFGDIRSYIYSINSSLYQSINSGETWELMNYFIDKPRIIRTFFDQKTNFIWIYVHDEGHIKNKVRYKGILWKMKLPWSNTDVTENNSSDSIFIFPNPAKDNIKINVPFVTNNCKISIFDIFGNEISIISKNNFQNKNQFEISLNENIPSGLYFVKVIADKNIIVRKLTIVK
jgi:hypothetical protein